MATLLLPIATMTTEHRQPMSASDWRMGASQRRYRDARSLRTWTLPLRGGIGNIGVAARAFEAGACGAALWDFTPPPCGDPTLDAPTKARFVALDYSLATANSGPVNAIVIECRSSD